ncbi:MAG: hypothetical protein JKX76_02180 [Colwellia sp.]|nr:hypothetical protein [Colwellia sp.]
MWYCGSTHVVILEVDENQHNTGSYSDCDTRRMIKIAQNIGGPPVIFVRYNPDPYRRNGEKLNPTQNKRHKKLLETLYINTSTGHRIYTINTFVL